MSEFWVNPQTNLLHLSAVLTLKQTSHFNLKLWANLLIWKIFLKKQSKNINEIKKIYIFNMFVNFLLILIKCLYFNKIKPFICCNKTNFAQRVMSQIDVLWHFSCRDSKGTHLPSNICIKPHFNSCWDFCQNQILFVTPPTNFQHQNQNMAYLHQTGKNLFFGFVTFHRVLKWHLLPCAL